MSTQQEYIESKGWHYIGTQEGLVFYRDENGVTLSMRLSQIPERNK